MNRTKTTKFQNQTQKFWVQKNHKSFSRIEKKLKRKTNQELVDTIIAGKKNDKWLEVAHLISMPRRKQIALNLDEIDKQVGDSDIVVIPGKVLGVGELTKKAKIVAFKFSKTAEEKLKKAGNKLDYIADEIKKNPEAKGVKILKYGS